MEPEPGHQLERHEGRALFGSDPTGYQAGRPEYPERIYEILTDRCGLEPGANVLEIGPGTGLATRRLLDAGARVTAVEPDSGLARYLSSAFPEVEIVPATLEEARLLDGTFDIAVAATSFHWVDQQTGLAKLGRCVGPGGWIALWWTLFRDPISPDRFERAAEDLLDPTTRGAFDEPGRPPYQLDADHRLRDLTRWARVVDAEAEVVRTTAVLSPADTRALYATMATVLRRPPDVRRHFLDAIEALVADRFGGTIERTFVTAIYTGRVPT